MATTYEPIATTTLGTAAASITFSSIAASWTDLRVVLICTAATNAYPKFRFNGDSGSNYSSTNILGTGSATNSQSEVNDDGIRINGNSAVTTNPSLNTVDVFSYAGSTYKTTLNNAANDKNGSGVTVSTVGLWRSTAAITSITLYDLTSLNFAAGSTATLYGILKA